MMPNQQIKKPNEKHKNFCELYLKCFQPKKAARESGFNEDYSYALLRNPSIRAYIKRRSGEIMSEIRQEQLKIFRELMNLATSDIRELYNKDGNVKPVDEWPDSIARCVSSIKQTIIKKGKGKDEVVVMKLEPKLWNKNQALESLAKVVGLLTSEVNINLPENVGSIYFPAPKEPHAEVDPALIVRDAKLQLKLHPGGKSDREKEDKI